MFMYQVQTDTTDEIRAKFFENKPFTGDPDVRIVLYKNGQNPRVEVGDVPFEEWDDNIPQG